MVVPRSSSRPRALNGSAAAPDAPVARPHCHGSTQPRCVSPPARSSLPLPRGIATLAHRGDGPFGAESDGAQSHAGRPEADRFCDSFPHPYPSDGRLTPHRRPLLGLRPARRDRPTSEPRPHPTGPHQIACPHRLCGSTHSRRPHPGEGSPPGRSSAAKSVRRTPAPKLSQGVLLVGMVKAHSGFIMGHQHSIPV